MLFLYAVSVLLQFAIAEHTLHHGGNIEIISDFEKNFDGWASHSWVRMQYKEGEKTPNVEGNSGNYYVSPGWTVLATPTLMKSFIIHPNSRLEMDFTCSVRGWKNYRSTLISHLLNPGIQIFFDGKDVFDFATHGVKSLDWSTYRLVKNFSSNPGKLEISFAGWEGSRRGKVGLDYVRIAWVKSDKEDAGGPIEYEQSPHKWRNISPHQNSGHSSSPVNMTTRDPLTTRDSTYNNSQSTTFEQETKNKQVIYETTTDFEAEFDGWESRSWFRRDAFGAEAKKYSIPPPPNKSKYYVVPGYEIFGYGSPRLRREFKIPPHSRLEVDFTLLVKGWKPSSIHHLLNLNPGFVVHYNNTRVFSVRNHAIQSSDWVTYRLITNFTSNTPTSLTIAFYGWTGNGRMNYIALDDIIVRWTSLNFISAEKGGKGIIEQTTLGPVSTPGRVKINETNKTSTEKKDTFMPDFLNRKDKYHSEGKKNDLIINNTNTFSNRPGKSQSLSIAPSRLNTALNTVTKRPESENELKNTVNGMGVSKTKEPSTKKGSTFPTERAIDKGSSYPTERFSIDKGFQYTTERVANGKGFNYTTERSAIERRSSTIHTINKSELSRLDSKEPQQSTRNPQHMKSSSLAPQHTTSVSNDTKRMWKPEFTTTQASSTLSSNTLSKVTMSISIKPETYSNTNLDSAFNSGLLFLVAALIVAIIIILIIVYKKYKSPTSQDEFTPINMRADGRSTVKEYDNPVFDANRWREMGNSAASRNQGRI